MPVEKARQLAQFSQSPVAADHSMSAAGCLLRLDSCLSGDPSDELRHALNEDNLRLFSDILSSSEVDVNREILPDHARILSLAVAAGKTAFVRELLRHPRLDVNLPDRLQKRCALHLAAELGQVEMLDLLLRHPGQFDVNVKMENGNTALHVLAQRSAARWVEDEADRPKVREDFVRATELVLSQPGVHLDYANNLGLTPLFFAVDKGSEPVARLLLQAGACVSIDCDGETIEDLLEEKMPCLYAQTDLSRNRRSHDTPEERLFQCLYADAGLVDGGGTFVPKYEELESRDNNNKASTVNVDADNGTYTFLQYACDQGKTDVAKFLLERGADPNYCAPNYRMPPLLIAGHHGYHKIVKLFLDFSQREGGGGGGRSKINFAATDFVKRENVLHKVLLAESKAHLGYDDRHYDRCLSLLVDNTSAAVNRFVRPSALDQRNHLGNTPLHVAAETGNERAVRKLLRLGANIGVKNKLGVTPIGKIPAHILEEFLDECLEGEGRMVDEGFRLIFKYAFLGPPLSRQTGKDGQLLTDNDDSNENEKDKLANLNADANDADADQDLPEAEPLWYLSQSSQHRELLVHPVISSFLCLKWRRIRPYYYTNLAFYLAFVGLLTAYLLALTGGFGGKGGGDGLAGLRYATGAFLVLLACREGFQAMVSFRRYIFSLENLLEVTMLLVTGYLLFLHDDGTGTGTGSGPTGTGSGVSPATRALASTALLLSWVEMVLLFGKHPRLSTYITMFTTVSKNFFWFLSWYLSFILAFGLAFYIVLHRPPPEAEDDEAENGYFSSVDRSLLKTLIMSLTGEIEFEGISFDGSLFAVVLFLLYVFFIMLVLVNLLNGLAVSDIGQIQRQAEVVSHVSRVELISYMESMLLGDPFQFLTNWPHAEKLRRLPSCSCLSSFYNWRPVRKAFDAFLGNTLLFRQRLREKRAVFEPNCSRFEASLPGPEKDNLALDDGILRAATNLVLKRQRQEELDAGQERLARMERALALLAEQQNHVIGLLNGIKKD